MVTEILICAKVMVLAGPLLGGKPKMPAQPLATDADAIAKAKQAKLMQAMAASGRSATDFTGQSDKMGG